MKRIISAILSAVLLLTAFTCFAMEETDIEGIKIGLATYTMKPGETQKVMVYTTPTGLNPALEYESDNPDVVTAAIGTIIANSEGVANITVKVSGTEIKDSVKVTVKNESEDEEKQESEQPEDEKEKQDEEVITVNKINIENKTLYLETDETERIVYSVFPDNATNQSVLFESSNTSVATVDEKGYVYAKRKGNASITVKSEDGKASTTVKVYVSDEDDDDDEYDRILRNIYITYDDEILTNKFEVMETTTVKLTVKASPSSASKSVKWRSTNKKIATVDSSGKVTGVKKGTCTIYATSTVNSSKRDSITIIVTDYVKFPDKISVKPLEDAVFKTGNAVQFVASTYPEDTTETEVIWRVSGGGRISQDGLLTITDSGEITVKAISKDYKTMGEYKLNAIYSEGHFTSLGSAYNLINNKAIEMQFDAELSRYYALNNIFACADALGNGEKIEILLKTDGKKVTVEPSDKWPEGDVYIFIKESLCDIHGKQLGKNLKYKLNIRGNVYEK